MNMLKKVTKIAMSLALSALMLVGCKADDDIIITSFSLDGAEYVCFEPTQTIKVGYNKQRISKIEVTQSPEGWTVTNRDNKYLEITAPNTTHTDIETIEVKGISPEGNSNSDKLKVQVLAADNLSTKGVANCYIAPTEGRLAFDGTAVAGSNKALDFTSAELLWCAPEGCVYSVQVLNGKVSFSTSATSGNAVIAVRDAKKNILWSWHIWVADYNPEENIIDGMMSRNLGASDQVGDTESSAWAASGLYYQWGRKDPFVGGKSYMSTVNQNMYNADGEWVGVKYLKTGKTYGTVDYAIKNPLTLLYGIESTDYDWHFAKRDNTLWSATTKSMYDPCPAGWRVAAESAFAGISMESVEGEYLRGWEVRMADTVSYFAAAGRRSFVSGELTNVDVTGYLPVGFVWSASAKATKAAALEFTPTTLAMGEIYRANACPVRCCKIQ
ncbi:MAG: hypothetical protein J6K81_05185 [Rikenellaceae bacterium]|nr:hypothetical protein [Rikenellaceae bacterium]